MGLLKRPLFLKVLLLQSLTCFSTVFLVLMTKDTKTETCIMSWKINSFTSTVKQGGEGCKGWGNRRPAPIKHSRWFSGVELLLFLVLVNTTIPMLHEEALSFTMG